MTVVGLCGLTIRIFLTIPESYSVGVDCVADGSNLSKLKENPFPVRISPREIYLAADVSVLMVEIRAM